MSKKVEDYVRSIPDFPEPGIIFRDVTSVIQSPEGLKLAIDGLTDLIGDTEFDVVVGPESRGFIFGVPVAYNTGKGFVPVRKKGKLPCETISADYELEYGTATIEMHKDAITPGQKVIMIFVPFIHMQKELSVLMCPQSAISRPSSRRTTSTLFPSIAFTPLFSR